MDSRDIIPSFYDTRFVGGELEDAGAFSNVMMRPGEVKRIVYPEDKNSRSRRFVEYDVLVQHRENGTAVTKMYHNCFLANPMGSLADYEYLSLRSAAPKEGTTADEASTVELGYGAKVMLLCLNGEHAEAVIIGGMRDERQTDVGRKAKGHHREWVFNGVAVTINDDGSFSVEYRGPTKPDGTLDTAKVKAAATGTVIKVEANGNLTAATKDRKQVVEINHAAGTISVTADKDLTVHGKTIHIGAGATEKAVLGDTLVSVLGDLIDAILVETHLTSTGPSGPPVNQAQYKKVQAKLKSVLSEFVTVAKKSG